MTIIEDLHRISRELETIMRILLAAGDKYRAVPPTQHGLDELQDKLRPSKTIADEAKSDFDRSKLAKMKGSLKLWMERLEAQNHEKQLEKAKATYRRYIREIMARRVE